MRSSALTGPAPHGESLGAVGRAALRAITVLAMALTLYAAPTQAAEQPGGDEPSPPEPVGLPLGEFLIKDYRSVEGSKTTLNFTAHAAVKEENAGDFKRVLRAHRGRMRDQVLTAARLTAPEELQDPDLIRLRRRIRLRLRHAIPELPIEDVYFSEFQYFVE